MNKRKSLGKGLSVLLSEHDNDYDALDNEQLAVQLLPLTQVQPGKFQPRTSFPPQQLQDLADSIKARGILQPIIVRLLANNRYEIIAGERRWRAAALAGLEAVPAIVRQFTDSEALELALIENLQRQDLTAIEEAHAYRQLMQQFAYTQEQVSEILGKSRSYVANVLRLLTLPAEVQDLVAKRMLSMSHARVLVNCENSVELAKKIVSGNLSVRESEELIARTQAQRQYGQQKRYKTREIKFLEERLQGSLGVAVKIVARERSGRILIDYRSLPELEAVIMKICQQDSAIVGSV